MCVSIGLPNNLLNPLLISKFRVLGIQMNKPFLTPEDLSSHLHTYFQPLEETPLSLTKLPLGSR